MQSVQNFLTHSILDSLRGDSGLTALIIFRGIGIFLLLLCVVPFVKAWTMRRGIQ